MARPFPFVALTLSIVAPLGVLSAVSLQRAWARQRANIDRQNVATARAISVAIDTEVETTSAALEVFAALHALDVPDIAAFDSLARRLIVRQHDWSSIILADGNDHVLAAFPDAFPAGVDAQVVGNPVRADIVMQPPPAERFARREGALRLLIVGGSLGASRLNTVVPFAVEQSGLDLHVRHQAGERGIESARAAYEEAGVKADVSPFITDMAQAMTDMIEVQRSFQMTSKALTMADQMAEIANGVKR